MKVKRNSRFGGLVRLLGRKEPKRALSNRLPGAGLRECRRGLSRFTSRGYDLAVIGGGIAGASFGKCMAEAGARVLILEAAERFVDRVRGEALAPWGFAEAKALGLDGALAEAGARQLRWANSYLGDLQTERRDIAATTLTRNPSVSFYHARMQECVLQAAEAAGAEVRRGVQVHSVTGGPSVRVTFQGSAGSEEISSAMAVIADGRNSGLRRSLGFEVKRDTQSICIAGVLLEGVHLPDDTLYWFFNPDLGEAVGLAPQGNSRVRAYLSYWGEQKPRLQGPSDVARLLRDMEWTGLVPDCFSGARAAGPLATFEAADTWVDEPYKEGVALLGDCAASNDPTWGQGLSIALRGSRTLRDALLKQQDWRKAGEDYSHELRRWYGTMRTVTGWLRRLFLETGMVADDRRNRAFSLIAQDRSRLPDLLFNGPDIPLDSKSEARLFGEDTAQNRPRRQESGEPQWANCGVGFAAGYPGSGHPVVIGSDTVLA
jgi:menaquinone-9 beta-reductase